MIVALFVATDGPYFGLPDVDPWDKDRDARMYSGPWPVVAHPPCERWGRYWSGGPSAKVKRIKGDDGGCFAAALDAVLKWGGVIEHPADSAAFPAFGIASPPKVGGWVAQMFRGKLIWVCHVEQGHYGHPARKATWLIACDVAELPDLIWGPSIGIRLEEGFHSSDERARARCRYRADQTDQRARPDPHAETVSRSTRSNSRAKEIGLRACEFLSRQQRARTPLPFRDLLLRIAATAPSPGSRPRTD